MTPTIMNRRATRWSVRAAITGAATALVLGLTAQQALAAPFTENGDAPSLPPGQTTTGTGSLDSISGTLSGNNGGDEEDAYRICVTGDGFFATTSGLRDGQLFLFDDDGSGVARGTVANDDGPGTLDATLPNGGTPLRNGGTLSYPPGLYYLAITGFDDDPVDASGSLIFPSSPFDGVYGPNPGVGPWTGWTGITDGDAGAAYSITMTGATFSSSGGCDGGTPPPAPSCTGVTPTITSNNATVNGTPGNDIIFGGAANQQINGLGGDDIICGAGGNDSINGGDGNDYVDGQAGQDIAIGGPGNDTERGGDLADKVGGKANDPGTDTLFGDGGPDQCFGTAGTDTFDPSCETIS